jgi:gas vesicle protein
VSAGLVLGAIVGAGAALLLAPQTGYETRVQIGRRARFARRHARDAWGELADGISTAARRGRRRARRALNRAKWRASDAVV